MIRARGVPLTCFGAELTDFCVRRKTIFLPVRGLEAQRLGLVAAAFFCRVQSAGERMHIEHRDTNRCRPQIAIGVAEEPAIAPHPSVSLARHDRHALGLRRDLEGVRRVVHAAAPTAGDVHARQTAAPVSDIVIEFDESHVQRPFVERHDRRAGLGFVADDENAVSRDRDALRLRVSREAGSRRNELAGRRDLDQGLLERRDET